MPTYSEEANIHAVVEAWYPMLAYGSEDSRLVVSGGGPWDKTLEILYSPRRRYEKLIVIPKPGTDHDTKVMLLYRYAVVHGADWVFQTNSDGQTVPVEFATFWKLHEKYDVIIDDRKKRRDGMGRKAVENVLRVYLRIFFGTFAPNADTPFRLVKSSVVAKYLDLIPADSDLPSAILAACFPKYHERICYRIMTLRSRQGGKNHMNMRRIFKIGLQSIRNFAEIRERMDAFSRRNRRNIQ